MPIYEMPLLLRTMSRPEVVSALKRVSETIFSHGGFIRKIDNLGHQPMPYKTRAHGRVHAEANYFILHFDVPPLKLDDITEENGRDIDIVRTRIFKKEEMVTKPCTFHEEMLPPAYRPHVQKLVALAKEQERLKLKGKKTFKYNSGLDYYPFQR